MTLPDVISGRPDFIVLSNYLIQPSFLLSTCPLLSTTRTLVLAHTLITPGWDSYDKTAPFDPLHPNIDVHYPKLNSRYGCMHSKFALLFYSSGVRVMVTTGNYISVDFGNMTNGIYVQDFPLKSAADDGKGGGGGEVHPFEKTLVAYLKVACSQVSGSPTHAVSSPPSPTTPQNFLRGFQRGSEVSSCPPPHQQPAIVWPTLAEVASSLNGYSSGRSIPAQIESLFDSDDASPSFGQTRTLKIKPHLAPLLHRWGNPSLPRTKAAPHIKTFLRYKTDARSGEPTGELGWAMMASHNFSMAAWGAVQKKGKQLSIEHYELGVLFTERDFRAEGGEGGGGGDD
ncbi:hypothetical protein TrRE_jg9092, partial [Triparma retinervis]